MEKNTPVSGVDLDRGCPPLFLLWSLVSNYQLTNITIAFEELVNKCRDNAVIMGEGGP